MKPYIILKIIIIIASFIARALRVHGVLFLGGGGLKTIISIYYNLRFKCMFDHIIHLSSHEAINREKRDVRK